jgi:hypothetical protein
VSWRPNSSSAHHIKSVNNLPEYAALLPHTSNGEVAELTDDRLPTPEEARLFVARADAKAPCHQSFLAAFAAPPINRPDAAQIWSAEFTGLGQLQAQFAGRKMTWGQYAGASQSLLVAARAQLSEADQRAQAARRANIIAAASVLSAMPNAFNQQPQTIYVRPCTIYSQIAHAC